MSWTFLSRFNIKADREAEFLTLIPPMEANAAVEPGTLAYKFYSKVSSTRRQTRHIRPTPPAPTSSRR